MSCIVFDHVNKSFQGKQVLKDVSFTVRDGELFGLLGPSGAGKTTILNILTGRLRPDGGHTSLWQKDCTKLDAATLGKIGTVLDQDGLYDRLSCYDNLLLYAQLHGVSSQKIIPVLAKVQLQDSAKKTVRNLSKGMRQRLVLARAILHKPDLLFLDEPTSGLDPATMQEIHRLLKQLQNEGTTIILTTHNMEEATALCDTVALLSNGEIVEEGSPKEICLRYDRQRSYHVLLNDGAECTFTRDERNALASLISQDLVRSIHTSEPNLETVFIEKTGRGLL